MSTAAGNAGSLAVAALVAAVGVGWFVTAQRVLDGASSQRPAVDQAAELLKYHRELVQQHLRAQCQTLSEDPRLKATLTVPNIDEVTIVDVLKDLREQSGLQLIATLTPQARVQAVLGGDQYRGLDLSTSSVVKQAQASPGAVPGTWVAGDRLVDVGVSALRVGDRVLGYLVIGRALEAETLKRIHTIANAAAGVIIERRVAVSQPQELLPVFAALAGGASGALDITGHSYATRVDVVPGMVPAVHLAFAAEQPRTTSTKTALMWTPLVLSVVAALAIAARTLLRS